MQKIAISAPLHKFVGDILATIARIDNWKKNLLDSNTTSTCPCNMVNFGLLAVKICWRVWCTPANFNGFRVVAALLHGTLLLGVIQTLQRWTEGATYIRQGGHHVGHWPTFLVTSSIPSITLNSLQENLSVTLMLHIHLVILISARWSVKSFSLFIGHDSLPCNIQLCTQLLYIFPSHKRWNVTIHK